MPMNDVRPTFAQSDMLDAAWDLIAGVHDGDWSSQSAAWRRSAEEWRDAYTAQQDTGLVDDVINYVEQAQTILASAANKGASVLQSMGDRLLLRLQVEQVFDEAHDPFDDDDV